MKTALIIPDCHHPYSDLKAYNLMLSIASQIKISEVVILGDFGDFYAVNAHGKAPSLNHSLSEEVFTVVEKLKELNSLFPEAKKVFIQGNHEYRLERFVARKCPELFGAISTERILHLDLLGWEFIKWCPYQNYRILGTDLLARHRPLGGGKNQALTTIEKARASFIFGDTHRLQVSHFTDFHQNTYIGISAGWLGDQYHEVYEYCQGHHQWQKGFYFIHAIDGAFYPEQVEIKKCEAFFRGSVYLAE